MMIKSKVRIKYYASILFCIAALLTKELYLSDQHGWYGIFIFLVGGLPLIYGMTISCEKCGKSIYLKSLKNGVDQVGLGFLYIHNECPFCGIKRY